jgi:hypothetical protein
MNNEPVAWLPKGMTLAKPKDLTGCIPLYTHPTKTLTDKEIWDWFKENTALEKESALKIARAILRKAQEK